MTPTDGALFLGDNGPSSEWGPLRIGARDEINIIVKGGNYGWPLAVGAPNHPDYVDPIIAWNPSQPPGDLTFYDADLFPELKGDLLYTTLRGETLMRFRFEDEVKGIFAKLGVATRAEAVSAAYRLGVVDAGAAPTDTVPP